MKFWGAKVLHKSVVLSLGVLAFHTACSNSSFRSTSAQTVTEDPAEPASEDATPEIPEVPLQDSGVTTTPIGTSILDVPPILKEVPDSLFSAFPTSILKDAETRFTLDLKDVSTTVTLKDKREEKTDNFTQNTRLIQTEPFTQGTPGETKTDKFTQAGKKGLVDILVVIDNSGSMQEEQANLSSKLDDLLVAIKDADWQVSVINTSPVVPAGVNMNNANSEGKELCVSTLIRKGDATAAADFARAVQAGVSGNGNEQGIRQAVVGLRCPGKTVVRPMSTVAVLIVSDEDNCSNGNGCGNLPWSNESYLINYVQNTLGRTVGKNAGFYGIVAPSIAACQTAGNAAPQYIRLFNTGSTPGDNYGNICDASYATTLTRISNNIALQLDSAFELSNKPDAGTLSVSITSGGVETPVNPGDYTLTEKTLKFAAGKEPANGSTINATYKLGAKPLFKSVTLKEDPAANTVSVKVDGAQLAPGAFTVTGRVVTFATQPAANAKISVDYRQNTPLIDRVKLASVPLAGTLKVVVNNVATTDFVFNAAANQVVLNQIPADGQKIDVSYTTVVEQILTYSVSIAAGSINFRLLDGTTPVKHTVDLVNNTITIDKAAFEAGKVLTLVYEAPEGERRFSLDGKPEVGTLNIQMMEGKCVFGDTLKIDEVTNELVANCPITEKTDFIVTYKYKVQFKSFTVNGIPDPEKGTFEVYYDGAFTTDYTREGAKITLGFDPEDNKKVSIRYTFPE
ncbi:hypothetical protein [Oligoflexus tunisiensis]|uniref:hypothetical protein n=1 Tax=Oligoflexus tunisiensis TaxID=708132 RepID=UPI00114CE73C|nr:hypothetical protein [Oligoflexus tunisiensis]